MSIHKWIDKTSMAIAGKAVKKKYFSESVVSQHLSEYLDKIELSIFQIEGEGFYKIDATYDDKTYEGGIAVEKWIGDEHPVIIYHHGAAEGSYDYSFKRILGREKETIPANLIAIQALFNHNNKEFMDSIASLSNYTLMVATSALIMEKLVVNLKQKGSPRVILCGTSLGGFVTNLHYTYFGGADVYCPMLAGPFMGNALVESAYTKVMSELGKENARQVNAALNFDQDFSRKEDENIFPLMASDDQIVVMALQSKHYKEKDMTIIPYGHATGATKYSLLREHITQFLN